MSRRIHKLPLAPSAEAVGEALLAIRTEAGLSQRELGKRLGVSQTWVYMRETGRARIDVGDFVEWCRACGVEPGAGFERLLKAWCGKP